MSIPVLPVELPKVGNLDPDAVDAAYGSIRALAAEAMDLARPAADDEGTVASTWSPVGYGTGASLALLTMRGQVARVRAKAGRAEALIARAASSGGAPQRGPSDGQFVNEAEVLGRGILEALRIADDAFTYSPVDHEMPGRVDGQLPLDQAVRLAQKLHHLSYHLPYIAQALRTVRDLDGNPVVTAGLAETEKAAVALYQSSERVMRDLDPDYGPHRRTDPDASARRQSPAVINPDQH